MEWGNMETRPRDGTEENASGETPGEIPEPGETPEDVAILYSWAHVQDAKYRDFSASRREYRAQIRYRAAEQLRLAALKAQSEAEAEAAKAEAEAAKAKAEAAIAEARLSRSRETQFYAPAHTASPEKNRDQNQEQAERMRESALRAAAEQMRRAAAERDEAARRAETAALADTIAQREEHEIQEARASGMRQAAQYRASGVRSRERRAAHPELEVPGLISDPYLPQAIPEGEYFELPGTPSADLVPDRFRQQREYIERSTEVELPPFRSPARDAAMRQRSGGFEQDKDPNGLGFSVGSAAGEDAPRPAGDYAPRPTAAGTPPRVVTDTAAEELSLYAEQHRKPYGAYDADWNRRSVASAAPAERAFAETAPGPLREPVREQVTDRVEELGSSQKKSGGIPSIPYSEYRKVLGASVAAADAEVVSRIPEARPDSARQPGVAKPGNGPVPVGTQAAGQAMSASFGGFAEAAAESRTNTGSDRSRNLLGERWAQEKSGLANDAGGTKAVGSHVQPAVSGLGQRFSETRPAWLYPGQTSGGRTEASEAKDKKLPGTEEAGPKSDLESTLQQSRERVAARWFALKGAFATPEPSRTNEPRPPIARGGQTPILAVWSLAGGVGKTSLVASLGRALSSLGERVLLADTTTHGLLPFYFGASQLHPGVVRTFSPPEGSVDAPIQLLSYDLEPRSEEARTAAVEDLMGRSKGLNRVLIDLNGGSDWLSARLARRSPTVLVPLAPDMNSVIGLQIVEKRFSQMLDDEGHPLRPFYLLSQFDAALPLHLDVREVLRQQLGERLLPFFVRRAASVSEALAEGMTIIDYAPESAIARDYLDVAKWIRSVSAPAAAVSRNLRWSER
jgi:cellulose synthase operon protein YhjQ